MRNYFYKKFLCLYLAKSTVMNCRDLSNCDSERNYWEGELHDLSLEIRITRGICGDIFGCNSLAFSISSEARSDANTLYDNKVYWMPEEISDIISYKERYKDQTEIVAIINKLL